MSNATDTLRVKADAFGDAIIGLRVSLQDRDDKKRHLVDVQSAIFVEKTNDGTIDGKNAETRDAQATLAYRQDTRWQTVWDTFVITENKYQAAKSEYEWTKTDLAVQATIVNAEIAQTGAMRLLAEVGLASV